MFLGIGSPANTSLNNGLNGDFGTEVTDRGSQKNSIVRIHLRAVVPIVVVSDCQGESGPADRASPVGIYDVI